MRRAIALLGAATLVAAACGGDDGGDDGRAGRPDSGDERPEDAEDAGELTASFRGVTADAIKVGIVYVNWDCIKDFVDFNHGDEETTYQIFVDNLNDSGGVGGRRVEPVYRGYCPIGNAEALAACTALTDDEQVFATMGIFIDFSGDAQLCLARDQETIHIGHELEQGWIDQAPPGLLLTPDITRERRVDVLLRLIEAEGVLADRKVAVLADDENESRARDQIVPALEDLGIELGSTAVLTVTGTETSAAHAQLDSFIERWKTEDVDTVFIAGLSLSARQWVEKMAAQVPDVMFVVDSPSSAVEAGRDAKESGLDPNPYENMIAAETESSLDSWEKERVQACVRVYEEVTGEEVIAPDLVEPGPDGERELLGNGVLRACTELDMLRQIAELAGPDLTNDTWTDAVHSMGPIELPNSDFASLGEGKYDSNDAFRLVRFDNEAERGTGGWVGITDVIDVAEV